MKNSFKVYVVCWLVLVSLFNVIAFITPGDVDGVNKSTGGFWLGYVFIMLALFGQLAITGYTVIEESSSKRFLGLTVVTINLLSMVVITSCGTLSMVLALIPTWISAVVSIAAFGFSFASVISTELSSANKKEETISFDSIHTREITFEVADLLANTTSSEIREEIELVYDALRHSDALAHESFIEVEALLSRKVKELAEKVAASNLSGVKKASDDIKFLIEERNRRSMILNNY